MKRNVGLSRADFKDFKPERRIQGRLFSLLIKSSSEGRAQYGCVVSKRIATRATVRNRIKRLCREALRNMGSVSAPHGTFVFYAKNPSSTASYKEVSEDIAALFSKVAK